ncbi:pantoate--beta-alanine ligase [Methylocaldum sp.]|uniref:pantoate--beta-alanine ligase n=1 Tax=Methylocaldum sp. TaxID=1969727 RepID=UPI002D578E20|nr:pantoate--beta-alanine ligase [Methylocaldum sp.]HYE36602.1 pantoate--beta-alanine ligase [Methylocaldum sp.]
MLIIEPIAALRQTVREWRSKGLSVAFVPTMGNLHAGHLHLVHEAKQLADRVVVSVFVNPAQFSPGEDFDAYPRTPDEDAEKLSGIGTDLLFTPSVAELYPAGSRAATFVEVPDVSDALCGRFRPGHFRGVSTIVCKLFNLVQPDVALFGEKDYQQLMVIRRMVADLDFPVRVHSVATVREPSGLAMSSRNAYLTTEQKEQAATLYRCLCRAAEAICHGEKDFQRIERQQIETLQAAGFRPDYFSVRRQSDLAAAGQTDSHLVVLAAAWLGKARLIDNVQLTLPLSRVSKTETR